MKAGRQLLQGLRPAKEATSLERVSSRARHSSALLGGAPSSIMASWNEMERGCHMATFELKTWRRVVGSVDFHELAGNEPRSEPLGQF